MRGPDFVVGQIRMITGRRRKLQSGNEEVETEGWVEELRGIRQSNLDKRGSNFAQTD